MKSRIIENLLGEGTSNLVIDSAQARLYAGNAETHLGRLANALKALSPEALDKIEKTDPEFGNELAHLTKTLSDAAQTAMSMSAHWRNYRG